MILLIDTTDPEYIWIGIGKGGSIIFTRRFSARYRQAELLLPAIQSGLRALDANATALRAVGVVSGPGPFSALRSGVVTANAIAFALGIPVIGLRGAKLRNRQHFLAAVKKRLSTAPAFISVLPVYGKTPSITVTKS